MTATADVAVECSQKKEIARSMNLLKELYPEDSATIRRIMHITGSYFRITYVDRQTGFVPSSYFVRVVDGVLTEQHND
jgi:hypothetical protein